MCGKVVEQQPADGNLLDIKHAGGLGQMLQRRIIGMKRQRNESLEPSGFILQRAQLQ